MSFFKKLFLGFSCTALLCMQGCTVTSSGDDVLQLPEDEEDLANLPLDVQELYVTGSMLSAFYVNAETELKEFEDYYQQGSSHGYPAEYYAFPDVEYMFSTLSDNFTRYFNPQIASRILNGLIYSESVVDIGAQVKESRIPTCVQLDSALCTDSATVLKFTQVYKNGPADIAGIKKGDIVSSVNGSQPTSTEVFETLTSGKKGETIAISVQRLGEPLEFNVVLASYIMPTVFVDEVEGIPVITISEFTDTTTLPTGTYGEFIEALQQTEGAEATIIDLRGNPGGTVDQCMNITSELIHKNDTMIYMISHDVDTISEEAFVDTVAWLADEDGLAKDRYLVFLADTGSASCAELMLAGAVSNTKSPIVGLTTYGKGIGQGYYGTPADGIAGITCMRMLDKDWKSYHKYGIEPDYVEGDPDKAMAIAVELAKGKTATRTKGYGNVDTGHFTLAKSHARAGEPERGGAYKIVRKPHMLNNKPIPFK